MKQKGEGSTRARAREKEWRRKGGQRETKERMEGCREGEGRG